MVSKKALFILADSLKYRGCHLAYNIARQSPDNWDIFLLTKSDSRYELDENTKVIYRELDIKNQKIINFDTKDQNTLFYSYLQDKEIRKELLETYNNFFIINQNTMYTSKWSSIFSYLDSESMSDIDLLTPLQMYIHEREEPWNNNHTRPRFNKTKGNVDEDFKCYKTDLPFYMISSKFLDMVCDEYDVGTTGTIEGIIPVLYIQNRDKFKHSNINNECLGYIFKNKPPKLYVWPSGNTFGKFHNLF